MTNLRLTTLDEGIDRTEADVTIRAPVADLRSQALVSGAGSNGLLIGKDRDPDQAQKCSKCMTSTDIVIEIAFPQGDGFNLRLCRGCVGSRQPGHPIRVNMELAE